MFPSELSRAVQSDLKLRINPKFYFAIVVAAALRETDQVPDSIQKLEQAINKLKVSWPVAYPLISGIWKSLQENENLDENFNQIKGISKTRFFNQYHGHITNVILNDDSFGAFKSNPTLAEFVKHFALLLGNGKIDSIFDPAFGLGSLVYAAFDGSSGPETTIGLDENGDEIDLTRLLVKKVRGNEINPDAAALANSLGQLFGFDANISIDDSLTIRSQEFEKYQLVVSEPPIGNRLDDQILKQDWQFGRPSKGSSEWAWAQIVQRSISKGGYGLLFVTAGALFRNNPSDVLIRAKMVSSGVIQAVFNLPSGLSPAHRAKMALIVLSNQSIKSTNEKILFVEISEPNGRKGTYEYSKDLLTKIHDACDVFEDFKNGFFEREIGYSAALPINDPELLKNDMNLNPALYVTQIVSGVNTNLSVKKDISQLTKKVAEIKELIDKANDELSTFNVKAEFINLGELLATGKIIQVLGMSKNDLKSSELSPAKFDAESGDRVSSESIWEKNISYISVDDVRNVGELNQTGVLRQDAIPNKSSLVYTQPNDVVLIKTGKPSARVDKIGGKLLFSPLSVLRITELGQNTISPEVLAFVLNGERIKKFMQGSTIGRLKIESVPIPIMDSINSKEINQRLEIVQRLVMKSRDLNDQLHNLEQKLNQVLAGEFDGLQENR